MTYRDIFRALGAFTSWVAATTAVFSALLCAFGFPFYILMFGEYPSMEELWFVIGGAAVTGVAVSCDYMVSRHGYDLFDRNKRGR